MEHNEREVAPQSDAAGVPGVMEPPSHLMESVALLLSPQDAVLDVVPAPGRGAALLADKVACHVVVAADTDPSREPISSNIQAHRVGGVIELAPNAFSGLSSSDGVRVAIGSRRLALAKLGSVPAPVRTAILQVLVKDRGVLMCSARESTAVITEVALLLARHCYMTFAAFDSDRNIVFVPASNAEETARMSRFLEAYLNLKAPPAVISRPPPPKAPELRGGPPSKPVDPTCETDGEVMAELHIKLGRLENRTTQQLDAQRHELAQLAAELRLRLTRMEKKHEALLNGRIFSLLRLVSNLLRSLSPKRLTRATLSMIREAVSAKAETIAPPSAVVSLPAPMEEKLPHPDKVALIDIPYMSRPRDTVSGAEVVYPGEALITVVMTTYNTVEFVEAAIHSILHQTWRNLELIVVDDCSSDGTREKVEAIQAVDSRLKLYCFGENRGTYWCKNFGISKASGSVITFMDSDDISEPRRLEKQFAALNQPGYAVSTCNHVRKDEAGKLVLINGVAERVAFISQMVKRKVFEEIGYFDTIRTSADDEFLRRVRTTYGSHAHINVREVLYTALLRDGSLTRDPANAINFVQQRNAPQSFLSPQRRHYAAMCERWHKSLEEKGLRPYMPFPVVRRPFPVFGKLRVDRDRYDTNMLSACMATYPPREEKLRTVIASLLPQVDHIYIYLNEYPSLPDFVQHPRITAVLGKHNLRDNGKFYFAKDIPSGYCFTVDDDITYPADYVQAMIRKLEFYERKAVIGLHGTIYAKPIRSFFKGRTLLHFEDALDSDTVVNQLGTGTVAFHTDLWRPELSWFKTPGMADVWLATQARRLRVPLIAVARTGQWLQSIGVEETTLFREFRKNDELQTSLVRELAPWREELSRELASSMNSKRDKYGGAYASLLPRLGVAQSAESRTTSFF